MPTNLPDPRKRESLDPEEPFLKWLLLMLRVAMAVAFATIIWSFWFAR